jgi:hypothetical protein
LYNFLQKFILKIEASTSKKYCFLENISERKNVYKSLFLGFLLNQTKFGGNPEACKSKKSFGIKVIFIKRSRTAKQLFCTKAKVFSWLKTWKK